MLRAYLIAHLALPAFAAIAGLVLALRREPASVELWVDNLVGGYLFYAAPHLAWAAIGAVLRPKPLVWHGGFGLSSLALVLVALLALAPGDPSGLPYQWLIYWPLAGLLLVLVLVAWLLAGRPRAAA